MAWTARKSVSDWDDRPPSASTSETSYDEGSHGEVLLPWTIYNALLNDKHDCQLCS